MKHVYMDQNIDPAGGAAPANPAPAAPTAPAAHGISWLAPDADPEIVGHVQNKAWKDPADAIKGHRELEKLLGADRAGRTVVLPKDDATDIERSAFFEKLGRPKSADDYGLQALPGADQEFAKAAAATFHANGFTKAQADGLMKWYNEAGQAAQAAQQAQEQAALEAEHKALEADWGTGPDAVARKEMARRAFGKLGLDEASVDALEKVVGFSKVMKAFAKVGDMMREQSAEGLGEVGSFTTTREGAMARRSQLMADPKWRAAAMNPQSKEWAELQRLDRVLAG